MNHNPYLLDHRPMTMAQWKVVGLCVLLFALDGFDVLSISFASPGIYNEWSIDKAALGVVLSMELVGMALGSIFFGSIADRKGRRPVILVCLVIMALGMLAAGTATTVTVLSSYRFTTGLGIGGILACINAMAAEFSNARNKNMAVILMAGGYPLGVVVGGTIASKLLETYDWRSIFYFGGAITSVSIIFTWFYLPESIAFLLQKRPNDALEKINKTLSRLSHQTIDQLPSQVVQKKTGIGQLLQSKYRRVTFLLTVAYLAHIMTFYFVLKWIPKLVVDMGFKSSAAGEVLVWANIGGLAGCVLLGILSQRFSVRKMLLIAFMMSGVMIAIFGRSYADLTQLAFISCITGFFTNAAVVGLFAIFAQSFPSEIRAGGTGFVIGVGRGGAAAGPIVAGLLFSFGYGLQTVAFLMALGPLVAFIAIWCLKEK